MGSQVPENPLALFQSSEPRFQVLWGENPWKLVMISSNCWVITSASAFQVESERWHIGVLLELLLVKFYCLLRLIRQ